MSNKKYIVVFLLFVIVATSVFSQRKNRAPFVRFGVRAGFNMSDLTSADGLDVWNGLGIYDDNLSYKGLADTKPFKLGFNAGLTAQIRINEQWSWQPSLLLTTKGYQVEAKYIDNVKEYMLKINVSAYYAQLPVDFVYKYNLSNSFSFVAQAGAFVGFGAFGTTYFEDNYGQDTLPKQFHIQTNRPYYNPVTGDPVMTTTDPTVHGSNLYWKDEDDTFIPAGTWRFDAGLQIGIGFELKSFALMFQYQYSFTPMYNYDADFTYRYEAIGVSGVKNPFEYLGIKNPGSPHQQVISVNLIYYFDNLKTGKAIRW
ncbi:MAG: PorT family protein [Bacteroidales bacterium]|jgi:hypothetical protein|nr:PorT family protein [Bacteroidales bacterium]